MSEQIAACQNAPRELLKHVSALDGVRGVAVLMILLYHLLWSGPETGNRLLNVVAQIRGAGWERKGLKLPVIAHGIKQEKNDDKAVKQWKNPEHPPPVKIPKETLVVQGNRREYR